VAENLIAPVGVEFEGSLFQRSQKEDFYQGKIKKGASPLQKTPLPLSFEGEGDTGGEVSKL